jgi:hypothetical protein
MQETRIDGKVMRRILADMTVNSIFLPGSKRLSLCWHDTFRRTPDHTKPSPETSTQVSFATLMLTVGSRRFANIR